jgi:glycosyltransferase involved in cell wall biosynthesis
MNKSKTILATAYAVNPYKGSEDGMGWNFILQIARFQRVIAITRENNQTHIDRYMEENPNPLYENITFLYFDLPYWARFWKRKARGAMLYYVLWQRALPRFIKKQGLQFDIAHNLNFHNDWTPSYLWKLDKPFVWGSVGHHNRIPAQYLKPYPKSYAWKDMLTWWVKQFFWRFSPALRQTVGKAKHVFCMNRSVAEVLPAVAPKMSLMPSVATHDAGWLPEKSQEKFTVISAGRFVPLKGFDLTILSFAHFLQNLPTEAQAKCELVLVGSGAEKAFLQTLVQDNALQNHVRFVDWIERTDLLAMFKEASVFLFPSHEGAGMVVAEALSFGLPVVCLDNSGAGEFITQDCGFAIPVQDYLPTVQALSQALTRLHNEPDTLQKMSQEARRHFLTHFHWDRRGEHLREVYAGL